MSENRRPVRVPPDDGNALLAWLRDVVRQVRLAWRLFWDRRVPLWTKLIPPAALAYALFPADIIPDWALGLGQLDDVAVVLMGIKLFIELAPPEVVREHLRALGARIEEWRVVEEDASAVVERQHEIEAAETQAAGAQESEGKKT